MKKVILAIATVSMLATTALPAAPLELRVELSPKSTLPGLPVVVRLVVTNTTSQPQELPKYLVLRVKQDGQEPFLAKNYEEGFAFTTNADVVPAGKTIRKPWPVTPAVDGGNLFRDERLRTPGEYDLELLMFREWPNFRPAAGFNAALDPAGSSLSATATLSIEEPAGDDAKVWEMIRAFESQRKRRFSSLAGERNPLVRQIVTLFPKSRYTPYLAGEGYELGPVDQDGMSARFEQGVAAMPDPYLRARLALDYADVLARWAANGDADTYQDTLAYAGRAKDLLTEIDKSWRTENVSDEYISHRMREIRGNLLTPDEYRKRFREARE